MKVVRTGTRISAFATFLLVGGCMAGGNTADRAELGVTPDGTSGGTGGGGTGGGGTDGGGTTGNVNGRFAVKTLTADQPGVGTFTDPLLQDVWGVASLQEQFFAVAQATGLVIGLEPDGAPNMHIPLVEESLHPGTPDKTGTGIAVLQASDNVLMDIGGNCNTASLIVASQSGKLWAVNPNISAQAAFVLVDRSKVGAQFTDVAVIPAPTATITGGDGGGSGGGGTPPPTPTPTARILAADFHNGRVEAFDVVDGVLQRVVMTESAFVIPNLPPNFSPFGLFVSGDRVLVSAAERRAPNGEEPKIDQQVAGDGKGIVAAFDLTGNLLWRTQSDMFNVPWGMTLGSDIRLCATGALLVGQHGNATELDGPNNQFGGTIIAMDIRTGKVIQPLLATDTTPVRIQGLWDLTFPTGVSNPDVNQLFTGSGPVTPSTNGQAEIEHGRFSRVDMQTP